MSISLDRPPVRRGRAGGAWRRVLVGVVLVGVALAGVDAIGDATQVRPERLVPGSSTELVVAVHTRDAGIAATSVFPSAFEQCRTRLHRPQFRLEARPLDGARYLIRSEPALGKHSMRKLRGCLSDLVVDFAVFDVEAVRQLPVPPSVTS